VAIRKLVKDSIMAQDGVRYLEQLLKQAGRETDQGKLDKLTAEIFRVVAEREKLRSRPRRRSRGI